MTAEQSRTGLNRVIRNVMMIAIMTAAILCCCMLTCHADSFTDEYGVTWEYEIAVYDPRPVIIKGCDNVPDGVLHIPAEIEGKAPEVIWMEAFMDNTAIRTIELPDSITNIGREAFYGCSNLQSLECPEDLMYINQNAFGGCTSLKEVKLNRSWTQSITTLSMAAAV